MFNHMNRIGLVDIQMSNTMRNNLFAKANFDPENIIDLAATNIKRGERKEK